MKRNMELVIEILKLVEDGKDITDTQVYTTIKATDAEILYHLAIMGEAGLIKVHSLSSFDEVVYDVERLTWEGHEFLDATRNEEVVSQVKEIARQKGLKFLDLPYDLVKDMSAQLLKGMLFG